MPANAKLQTDLDALQGTWAVTALEIDGMPMNPVPPGARITVEGTRFTTAGMGAEYSGNLALDGSTEPRRFDLAFTSGPEKGNTALGIYELEGGSWKMCLTTRGGDRPTRFATSAGTGHALQTLTRGTPAAITAEVAAPPGDPAPELEGEWVAVSLIVDGRELPQSMLKTCRRIAEDGEIKVFMGPETIVQVKFAVDRSRQPMEINYVHVRSGESQAGIYSFEGGLLKTCLGRSGGPRPDTFDSQPGDARTVTVWKKKG
ncbi:MAG TPA: TIGR03067 domain-containing protein [Candidatus Acidoferrales bacterium]|nr:TIGR03067 domain-containing protein [Candidatus Acidoferrales bacterium]